MARGDMCIMPGEEAMTDAEAAAARETTLARMHERAEKAEAKLAEYLRTPAGAWQAEWRIAEGCIKTVEFERDEARAEAAAYRRAILHFIECDRSISSADTPQEKWRAVEHFESDPASVQDFIEVLSQPAPGAVLLDKLKRYEDALRWYAYEAWTSRDDMGMWVHKIDRDGGDRARAALEEKS